MQNSTKIKLKNLLLATILIGLAALVVLLIMAKAASTPEKAAQSEPANSAEVSPSLQIDNSVTVKSSGQFLPPIDDAQARITLKKFGQLIIKGQSPVPDDRFSGYHVGTDFETFANEQEVAVPIKAICSGPLRLKKYASGYGGVAVQQCDLNGEVVTIIYGHLKLASIPWLAGDQIMSGQQLGILGKGYSAETDGERKHLHLGVHKGAAIDIRGYVQDKKEIDRWLDVTTLISLK